VLPLLPGMLDLTFNPSNGPNSEVRSVITDASGRIYVGGAFWEYNGTPATHVARLNQDGNRDATFAVTNNGDNEVYVLAGQTNGQVLVGGAFYRINGSVRTNLARLNADGTVDFTFSPAINGAVWAIAIQSDGKILIGGDFFLVGGAPHGRLARLNSDGTVDGTFGASFSDSVRTVVLQPDGRMLVGGNFTSVNGTLRNRITRLLGTGANDPTFNPLQGADYWVNALSLQPDGKVIVAGSFSYIRGVYRPYLARLNDDGTFDSTFNQGGGPNSPLTSLALQADGKVIIGGGFYWLNGENRNYFTRLTTNGSNDFAFYSGGGANYWVESLALQSDGKILVAGAFTYVNNQFRRSVARVIGGDPAPFAPIFSGQPVRHRTVREGDYFFLSGETVAFPAATYQWQFNGTNLTGATSKLLQFENVRLPIAGNYQLIASNAIGMSTSRVAVVEIIPARTDPGAVDVDFYAGDGPNSTVRSISLQSDGRALIGGYFLTVDGVTRFYNARLNTDGSLDPGFLAVPDSYVSQIEALPSGAVLMCGGFESVNALPQACIALLTTNSVVDLSFHPQFQQYSSVANFLVQTNGKVVITGYFVVTNFDGLARTNFARLNPDGAVDPTFNAGLPTYDYVYALAEHVDGKILLGGIFNSFNGVPRNGIVRLNTDGSVDTTFDPGSGASSGVFAMAVLPDRKILVAGRFRSFNGVRRHQIARLNADGSLDTTFDPGPGPNAEIITLNVQPDGKILIGGSFNTVGDQLRHRLARLNSDGSLDLTFDPGWGANDSVFSIATLPDGDVMVGGQFTSFDLLPRPFIARLHGGYPPPFAPTIVSQPETAGAQAGDDATFRVVASAVPEATYQWKFNGVDIPGATQWTLTLRNVRSTNQGQYSVVVSNALGQVPSSNAWLYVDAPSRFAGMPDISFYTGAGPNDRVHALAVQNDKKILIGGAFTQVDGVPRGHIARLNYNGSIDMGFNSSTGANERVFALALQPDQKMIAAGSFTAINNVSRTRIARFNTNGVLDATFNPGLGANAEVYALAVQPDGRILIGGRFNGVGGVTNLNGLARLFPNGVLDPSFTPALNVGAVIYSVAVQTDGKIIAGGYLYSVGLSNHNYAVRLNPDGTIDNSFQNSGANNVVSAIDLQEDGRVVLGGDFYYLSGLNRVRVGRLETNGAVDLSFIGSVPNNAVNALQVQSDGETIIGGEFKFVNSYYRSHVARLLPNGTLDYFFANGGGLTDGSSYVDEYGQVFELTTTLALALEANGKVLVAGDFTRVNGIARPFVARLFGREASDAIAVMKGNGAAQISWDTGVLEVANQVTGPWTEVPVESPATFQLNNAQKFFRLKFN
jgi:uncharacterized delta-60 repeat protein